MLAFFSFVILYKKNSENKLWHTLDIFFVWNNSVHWVLFYIDSFLKNLHSQRLLSSVLKLFKNYEASKVRGKYFVLLFQDFFVMVRIIDISLTKKNSFTIECLQIFFTLFLNSMSNLYILQWTGKYSKNIFTDGRVVTSLLFRKYLWIRHFSQSNKYFYLHVIQEADCVIRKLFSL